MSSTERAPEPTMEEILASIRRIISDDESSSVRQPTASARQQDDEGLEAAEEGEADDAIINDIARVLSGSASAAEEEEDILDLTAELGGLELVEVSAPDAEMVEVVEMVEVIAEAPAPVEDEAPEVSEAAPEPELEAPAVAQAPEPKAPEPAPAPPLNASDEAASALERAIAALRAGHVPTSIPEFMPRPDQSPVFASQPEPEPEAAPEPEPEPEPELETELVLTEFEAEMVVEEPVELEAAGPSEPEESSAWGGYSAPWVGAPEPQVEPERPAAHANGGSHGATSLDAAHKTLEDSVKDMLRPMLRQWLDENMPRVLTAALKDELGDSGARGQGD